MVWHTHLSRSPTSDSVCPSAFHPTLHPSCLKGSFEYTFVRAGSPPQEAALISRHHTVNNSAVENALRVVLSSGIKQTNKPHHPVAKHNTMKSRWALASSFYPRMGGAAQVIIQTQKLLSHNKYRKTALNWLQKRQSSSTLAVLF